MKKMKNFLIGIYFVSSLLGAAMLYAGQPAQHSTDFWRTKPNVLRRIEDEREIIATVKTVWAPMRPISSSAPVNSELQLIGGGALHVGIDQAFKGATQYEKLVDVSEYIQEVKTLSKLGEIFVHVAAFDYHAKMTMRVTERAENKKYKRLEILILDGHFKGMTGEFTFEAYKPNQTLMGLSLSYAYNKLPFPQFFVEFALEFVMKKVAYKLRTHLEKPSAV